MAAVPKKNDQAKVVFPLSLFILQIPRVKCVSLFILKKKKTT